MSKARKYAYQDVHHHISRIDGKGLSAKDVTLLEDELGDLMIDWLEKRGFQMNGSSIPMLPTPTPAHADATDFGEEKECEVSLTDWVRMDAVVTVTARSRQEAAEKAVALAEDDEVDWTNSYDSQGKTEVDWVTVQP